MPKTPAVVFTIGRSTRSIDTFIEMLQAHGVERLVDVRTIPRSRHNPQFNRDGLQETLLQADKAYMHIEELGGLRHARKETPTTRDGTTLHSAASPITCKRRNLKLVSRSSSKHQNKSKSR